MENRTVSGEELSKLTYNKQLLKKAISCKSPYNLSNVEKDNLFSILADNGLSSFCNDVLQKMDVQCELSLNSFRCKEQ